MFAMLLGLPLAARAQSGSPVGTPLPPSPSAQSSPAPTASPGDSLSGTWHTDAVTEADLVAAFVAGGGNETDGRDFFGQLGHFDSVRNTQYAVIGARFVDGLLTGLEGGDGAPEVQGGQDTYEVSADGVLTMTDTESPFCVGHYGITLSGDRLLLRALDPFDSTCGPYGATLFGSFPFHRDPAFAPDGPATALPPNGVYQSSVTADDLQTKGVAQEDASARQGLVSWTLQDGKGSFDRDNGEPPCAMTYRLQGSIRPCHL